MQNLLSRTALIMATAVALGTADLSAQSVDLNSSMTGLCADPTCGQITFSLNVAGQVYMSNLLMKSLDPALWKFGSLAAVLDANGNDVSANWLSGSMVSPDQMYLVSGTATFSAEPIHFLVNMVQPPNGTQGNLAGNVWYFGNGYQTMDANGVGSDRFSTVGVVVVNEPSTSVLLAAGLIGILGVSRRRERLLLTESGSEA